MYLIDLVLRIHSVGLNRLSFAVNSFLLTIGQLRLCNINTCTVVPIPSWIVSKDILGQELANAGFHCLCFYTSINEMVRDTFELVLGLR